MAENRPVYVPVSYGCGGCDNRWRGLSRAHCAACHRTWSTVSGFDKHRRDVNGKGTCLDPAAMRTKAGEPIFRQDELGVWKLAGDYERENWAETA